MKLTKDYLYQVVQILELRASTGLLQPSWELEVWFPDRKSMSYPMMGIAALKQTTKEAQMKGMAQVKQVICHFVLGVISPQPIVVAVTTSWQRVTQSSGIAPSGSPKVHSLYPSKERPRKRYSVRVYLKMLRRILSKRVREFPGALKRSSMASPIALKTQIILRKKSPLKKLQLLGIRVQLKHSEMASWSRSKRCLRDMMIDRIVKPISSPIASRHRTGVVALSQAQMPVMIVTCASLRNEARTLRTIAGYDETNKNQQKRGQTQFVGFCVLMNSG